MIDTDIRSSEIFSQDEPLLLLSVYNSDNRKLFKKCLPKHLSVEVNNNGIGNKPFDLCILDEQSFQNNKKTLQSLKDQVAPIFLPILLLSPSRQKARSSTSVLEFVDDVIYKPVTAEVLQGRVQMLLQQRKYSLILNEKNKELENKTSQLRKEKKKYQLITENATDMICRHSPDGTLLFVSPACKQLTGYKPSELIGRSVYNLLHPDDLEAPGERQYSIFHDTQDTPFTYRLKQKGGGYRWVETTSTMIRNPESQEVIEIQSSTRDVNQRVTYEKELKQEKEFTNTAIEGLPGLFYMIDEDQNYIKWNKNLETELGYTAKEISELNPLDFYREEDHSFVLSKIKEAYEKGHTEAELNIQTKDGHTIPYFVTGKTFSENNKDYLVGYCVNLSELKEAQYETEQHRQLLNAIINQTNSIIYVKDKENRFQLVNDKYLELFDLKRENVIGKTGREIHGNIAADSIAGKDKKVFETSETIEVKEELPVAGKTKYYHTIKYMLKGVPGYENCLCGISTDITELNEALNKLQERIKEQQCIHKVSNLAEQDITISELLSKTVSYLPDGWQYPEITEAAILYDNKTYKTEGFTETDWMLTARSKIITGKPLQIKVAYTEQKRELDEGPFLKEERRLIDAIEDTLAAQIDRILAREKLKSSEERWKKLVKNDPNLIQLLNKEGTIQFINPAGAKFIGKDDPKELEGQNIFDIIQLDHPVLAKKKKC